MLVYGDAQEVDVFFHLCASNVSSEMVEWSSLSVRLASVSSAGRVGAWTSRMVVELPWSDGEVCVPAHQVMTQTEEISSRGCTAGPGSFGRASALLLLLACRAGRRRSATSLHGRR